jgi:hypothetical protein
MPIVEEAELMQDGELINGDQVGGTPVCLFVGGRAHIFLGRATGEPIKTDD